MASSAIAIIGGIRFYIMIIYILGVYNDKKILVFNIIIKLANKILKDYIMRDRIFNQVKLTVSIQVFLDYFITQVQNVKLYFNTCIFDFYNI